MTTVKGGRGLIEAEDCIKIELSGLMKYAPESHELLLKSVLEEGILKKKDGKRTKVLLKESTKTIFHSNRRIAGAKKDGIY